MPSPHSLYGLRVILTVPAYFYMNVNYFGLPRVVSSWVSLLAADSFGWVIADGFRWFRVISDSIGWFAVLVATSFFVLPSWSLHTIQYYNIYKTVVKMMITIKTTKTIYIEDLVHHVGR